ncbi:hypothetical protein C7212DRAFT_366936 [Tuber magnatum]|uniref:Uncharacterized protein n=1 Tax=Tuber magnatum TaxID=42249 RepID=A0A317SBL7_9PEZI|nr:hypothetical protein C7212DRAFT_366936 [Tuber magnatum]
MCEKEEIEQYSGYLSMPPNTGNFKQGFAVDIFKFGNEEFTNRFRGWNLRESRPRGGGEERLPQNCPKRTDAEYVFRHAFYRLDFHGDIPPDDNAGIYTGTFPRIPGTGTCIYKYTQGKQHLRNHSPGPSNSKLSPEVQSARASLDSCVIAPKRLIREFAAQRTNRHVLQTVRLHAVRRVAVPVQVLTELVGNWLANAVFTCLRKPTRNTPHVTR